VLANEADMDTGSLRESVAFIGCALPLQELALPLGEADSLAPLMPILGIGDRCCASSNYARKGTNYDFPHMYECGDADVPVSRELRSPGFGRSRNAEDPRPVSRSGPAGDAANKPLPNAATTTAAPGVTNSRHMTKPQPNMLRSSVLTSDDSELRLEY
jgi:hypothetical protein